MTGETSDKSWFRTTRRKILTYPTQGFLGYAALRRSVDETAASADSTSTTVIESVSLPKNVDELLFGGTISAWTAASHDTARITLYVGGVKAYELICHPERAGEGCFDENPPVEARDGRNYVMVKFPREQIVASLDEGEVHPQVLGATPSAQFRGQGTVTVSATGEEDGGPDDDNPGRGPDDNPGRGSQSD